MRRPKIHVLYESGVDQRPHGSAFLRLLLPLSTPAMKKKAEISFGSELPKTPVDIVLVDRLWQPAKISRQSTEQIISEIRAKKAKLIYCFDDDFLGIEQPIAGYHPEFKESVKLLLASSQALVVTTEELKKAYQSYQTQVSVIPSHLDETLLIRKRYPAKEEDEKITIGYMGTATHHADLEMVAPALRELCAKYSKRIRLQIIGALREGEVHKYEWLKDLPLEVISPQPFEVSYPNFMVWFTSTVQWDFGIAPLQETAFNRCKSDIKFLDYTAAGAPGIFSRVPAYQETIEHGKTGILAPNTEQDWFESLDLLTKSLDLRRTLIKQAETYLYTRRILGGAGKLWDEVLGIF